MLSGCGAIPVRKVQEIKQAAYNDGYYDGHVDCTRFWLERGKEKK